MNTFKFATIITAGGTSSRFGSNKLLEKLGDKTVIEVVIEKFLPYSSEIIVPAGNDIKEFLDEKYDKVRFASAGRTRQESVFNALKMCSNPDYVLIHDGARPFIEDSVIRATISEVVQKRAVVVCAPAIDTIKIVDEFGKVKNTTKREVTYHAQTPQAFDFSLIYKVHQSLEAQGNFTDDASMLEALGEDVWVVQGSHSNKKITFREDLN